MNGERAKAVRNSGAPAIGRAAAILRLLGKSERPMGLLAIAKELDLVPSTCLYTLRALAAEEFVACDPDTKRYTLEAGVLTLARLWLRRNEFTDLAQPVLESISSDFNVTAMGVNVVGLEHMIVVAVAQSNRAFQISAQIGSRFPALISATGRCIAAFGGHGREELAQRFRSLRWDNPPSFKQWLGEVEQTRQQGFAVDSGNYIGGVTVVAAPVWKTPAALGHAIVAIAIGGDVGGSEFNGLQDCVRAEAEALSVKLCGEER